MTDELSRRDDDPAPSNEISDLASAGEGRFGRPANDPFPVEDEELDVRRLLHLLWRRKGWILLATAAGVAVGVFLYQRSEPVYETRSTVWVESSEDRQTGPIQAEEIFQGRGWSDLFRSLAVLRPVAREMDLYLGPSLRGRAIARGFSVTDSVVPGTYRLAVDSAGGYELIRGDAGVVDQGSVGDSIGRELGFRWAPEADRLPVGGTLQFRVRSPTQAAFALRERLSVSYNPRSGNIIASHLRWPAAKEAARVHNRLVDNFINVASRLKSQKLREVVNILEQQTQYAEKRLAEAELQLKEARIENVTLPTPTRGMGSGEMTRSPVFDSYFEDRIRANQLASQVQELESVLQSLRDSGELNIVRLRTVPAVNRSPQLLISLDSLTSKQARRRSLLTTYTEEHPRVQSVTREIGDLKTEVIPHQIENLISQLRNERESLQQNLAERESDLRDIPPRLIEEERLRREMQQAEQLHSNLLNRLKNAQLAASTSMPNLQVVDRAYPPSSPVSNQGPRLFMLASLAGLGVGIVGTIAFDRLDRSIREPDQIETGLGLPVLGVIPRIESGAESRKATEGVLESFRSVRTQISRLGAMGRTSLLVTSPEPEDGKSLVAANLAISFANGGRSTVFVDADVRRGDAHRLLGIDRRPGLTDFLSGRAELNQVLQATDVEGLMAIPSGRQHGFNPDRLESQDFVALMNRLKTHFDAVVVDSAPLAAGSDAPMIAEQCEQCLLVIREGRTDEEMVRSRLEALNAFDISRVSVVLNDVPDSAPYYRYYSPSEYYLESPTGEEDELAS